MNFKNLSLLTVGATAVEFPQLMLVLQAQMDEPVFNTTTDLAQTYNTGLCQYWFENSWYDILDTSGTVYTTPSGKNSKGEDVEVEFTFCMRMDKI